MFTLFHWNLNSVLGLKVAGACECGEKPSGSIKHGEFLD
jgi:hypothetical protein